MFTKVYQEILRVYPFLIKKEKEKFLEFYKKIERNKNLNEFEKTKKILDFLKNPHADIFEILAKKKTKKNNLNKQAFKWNIKNNILYLEIPSWSGKYETLADDLIKVVWDNQDQYQKIIIDVSKNEGGSSFIAHKFASIFFKKQVIYGKIIRKNLETNRLKTIWQRLKPNKDFYIDKKVEILISEKCFSANELFLAPFKISKRAKLIGKKTAGGSGNPISLESEYGSKKYIIRIPTWRFILKGETEPIEKTKIKPD